MLKKSNYPSMGDRGEGPDLTGGHSLGKKWEGSKGATIASKRKDPVTRMIHYTGGGSLFLESGS